MICHATVGGRNSSPNFSQSPFRAGWSLQTATTAPPWAGCRRAAQVISSTDDVAGQSQLADDRVFPARAGGDGIRDEAGGVVAAGQT